MDVRFGSEADICAATSHVRFTPNSDRKSRHAANGHVCFHPKADMCSALAHVCFGPIADTALSADHFASCAARKASDSFFSSCGVSLGGSTATVSLLIFPVNVKGVL